MAAEISIRVDSKAVTAALDKLDPKTTTKTLTKAFKKGGNFLAGKARAEAPPHPAKLKRSIRARAARRDRPGIVVSAHHRLNPIVQEGTVQRHTKSGANRGRIKANPFITRTADRYGNEALDMAERELSRLLDL